MKTRQNRFSLIIVILVIIFMTVGIFAMVRVVQDKNKAKNEKTVTTAGTESGTIVVTGVIDSFGYGCQADDAFCTINLKDGTQLITKCGGLGPDGQTGCKASYDRNLVRKGDAIEATVVQKEDERYYIECNSCGVKVTSDVSYYIPNYDESAPGSPPGSVNLRGVVTDVFNNLPVDGDAGVIIDDKYRVTTDIASWGVNDDIVWGSSDIVAIGDVVAVFAAYGDETNLTLAGHEQYRILKVQ